MNTESNSNFDANSARALELIFALCDDRITLAEAAELESIVLADIEICRLYVRLMQLNAGLYQYASALGAAEPAVNLLIESVDEAKAPGLGETMVLPAMKQSIEFDDVESPEFTPAPARFSQPVPVPPSPFIKPGIAAVLLLAIGISAYFLRPGGSNTLPRVHEQTAIVQPTPVPIPIAVIDVEAGAVWRDGRSTAPGRFFEAGESLSLKSGAIQLHLPQSGGKVVVEGPVDLQFVSNSEFILHQGRLVATIPGGGLIVQCPTGSVTDLGTQFGLSVAADGGTEVAVFEGKVSASISSAATTQPVKDLLLTVGQAAVISQKAMEVSKEGAIRQRFICNLQNEAVTALDVTDLVSGGDGTTKKRGIGIDSLTGEIGALPACGIREGNSEYHRVKGYPVVDGVFVPNGSLGDMVVDSAGDQYHFQTRGNVTCNLIWTGGRIPWWNDPFGISTVLNDVDYSTPGHGIICTHSNNAITLDLDAVRRMYPNRTLSKFRSLCGNSYINGWHGSVRRNPIAGVYVLVDGACRYQKPSFTSDVGGFPIDVPLSETDRFLTLASTDGGTYIDQDWVLWADAMIELAEKK